MVFHSFIAEAGGHSNAFTTPDHTNYHVSVNADALHATLQHFSTFFKSPLFAPELIEKEMLAVDSEYLDDKQDDGWRAQTLRYHLSRPDHPLSNFGCGSYDTLYNEPKARKEEPRSVLY